MSPEKARVFVAEDEDFWQDAIKHMLERGGHSVVATAKTLPEALAATKRLQDQKVDVAVIDGNLNEDDTSGSDGQAVLKAVREHAPKVKTVGMSGNSVPGTDYDLGKADYVEIGKVVKKL